MNRTASCFFFFLACALVLLPGCPEKGGQDGHADRARRAAFRSKAKVPHVVPYLDCIPSAKDGEGLAVLKPSHPLKVGSREDFEIAFTVGKAGVAPGGFVMLQVSPWWGWSPPQTLNPEKVGYTTASTTVSEPRLQVRTLPLNRILVFSPERGFKPGETITFHYGNRASVDRFAEAAELFQIFVDADGDGHSACIQNPPGLRIEAAEASMLAVTVQPILQPGKATEVRAAPLDTLGNWSRLPLGNYRLRVARNGKDLPFEAILDLGGGEKTLSFPFTPAEEGIYFFRVEGPKGLEGGSNVMLCQKGEPGLKLFFGDIHGHSRMSDGTGTPEDFYRYAREVSGLDIAALTDHCDFGTIPVKGEVWERIKKAANNAYVPGRFVTFVGFEWTNWEYGHRNVYYRDGAGPVFRSIDEESDTPQKLWKLLEPYEAMTVAHHVGGGPVATNWDIVPGPREWLVEISSVHGSSECYGCEARIYNPVKGAFVRDALARGYKLGIIGSGDTHDGHPGQRSMGSTVTGLVGVYSSERTREAVWDAFRKRRVYATSGPKIILNFRVADAPMGSEVRWAVSKGAVPIALRAVGCEDLAAVEILRNGERIFRERGQEAFVRFVAEDPEPPVGTSWYYARVLQRNGDMAWSSPVWVTVE